MLQYLTQHEFPGFGPHAKLVLLKETLLAMGRSALVLSGGATIGECFHLTIRRRRTPAPQRVYPAVYSVHVVLSCFHQGFHRVFTSRLLLVSRKSWEIPAISTVPLSACMAI